MTAERLSPHSLRARRKISTAEKALNRAAKIVRLRLSL